MFSIATLSIEYALLIAVALSALIGAAVIVKRAIGDRYRTVGDSFGYPRRSSD